MKKSRGFPYERMKLGVVIGRVTLSRTLPPLEGARWLIISPFTREHYQRGTETPAGLSKDPSLVAYDSLGGEGYLSYSIATPTGEGVTNPRTFTRVRRCVMVDNLRIY